MASVWVYLLLLLGAYFFGMLCLMTYKKDRSIANFTWGGGVLLVAWYELVSLTLSTPAAGAPRPILIAILVTLWCLRMVAHLYMRYTGRDPRFTSWREQEIFFKQIIYNITYLAAQFILTIIMAWPILMGSFGEAFSRTHNLIWLDYVGLSLWIIGFIIEAVSDYQLFAFIKNPANKGKVMQSGLWRYSRHPNYFGEVLIWWGILLIESAAFSSTHESFIAGCYMAIAPITITILLRFFTGVPWLERAMANNPEYQEYKKRTNIFVPWFVKH